MDDSTEPLIASGYQDVKEWFNGQWPNFHDAEIVTLALVRKGDSVLKIYPYYPAKPATVEFHLQDITDLELADFSVQNVISSLTVERVRDQTGREAVRIRLGPCFGVSGWIDAKAVRVKVQPGKSADGVSLW